MVVPVNRPQQFPPLIRSENPFMYRRNKVAVAGEKRMWTEPLRSFMMQTQVQPGQNALRGNKTPKVHAPATSGLQP